MSTILKNKHHSQGDVQPLCPVFGECGGCLYQDIQYVDELAFKEKYIKSLFEKSFDLDEHVFHKIIPSPKPYHYRNRLDLKLKRTKSNDIFIGFTPADRKGVVPVEACFIADEDISDFIPELKRQAVEKLPKKYKNANLTVRVGQDGRVLWGGIGRKSCQLSEQDYFWIEMENKKIFYSLDTFFQANTSILSSLFDVIAGFKCWDLKPIFYDLYGGVGLFSIGLSGKVNKAVLIEENASSIELARHNVQFNKLSNIEIIEGKVEENLFNLINQDAGNNDIVMVDPPRAGLSKEARCMLSETKGLRYILYLSCNPESLVQDLREFVEHQWKIQTVVPFDFFPKTKHIETLVLLQSHCP